MVFIHLLFIHLWEWSLDKHLLRICYVSGIIIAAVDTKLNKSSVFRRGDMIKSTIIGFVVSAMADSLEEWDHRSLRCEGLRRREILAGVLAWPGRRFYGVLGGDQQLCFLQ